MGSVVVARDSETAGYSRQETEAQRLDRNYAELLQELRVETGVQLLFAFLLSIAFQSRFNTLSTFQRDIYLAALISAALSAVLLIAPVSAHRLLFRRRLKDELVVWTSHLTVAGLAFLLLSVLAAVLLIVDVVAGGVAAGVVTGTLAVVSVWLWYLQPAGRRRAVDRPVEASSPDVGA